MLFVLASCPLALWLLPPPSPGMGTCRRLSATCLTYGTEWLPNFIRGDRSGTGAEAADVVRARVSGVNEGRWGDGRGLDGE